MSVNPLCSQAVKDTVEPNYKVTEHNVINFNKKIYDGLCSGNNKYFTYIDEYNRLLDEGWFPAILRKCTDEEDCKDKIQYDETEYDGIHYIEYTSLRIYNHCMEKIGGQ